MRYPMNDVVVVLPGIMGSTLHKNGKPVWEPPPAVSSATSAAFSRT